MLMEETELPSCIRRHHIYKSTWTPTIGEQLECKRECTNAYDRYAVAVVKNQEIVGHLPRKISKICSLFLRRGGNILCTVSGRRRHSTDLQQGGLEVPCDIAVSNIICQG